jgi:Calcineurin-like phosphoesterase
MPQDPSPQSSSPCASKLKVRAMTRKSKCIYLLIAVCFCASIALFLFENKLSSKSLRASDPSQAENQELTASKTIIAVGDIACPRAQIGQKPNECQHELVASKIKQENVDGLFLLGDIQYPKGEKFDLESSFVPAFGSLLAKSYITLGNHEYYADEKAAPIRQLATTAGAKISTAEQPYLKSSIGDWSIYILDSNCEKVGGCGVDSQQYKWFNDELTNEKSKCSIALWHHPVLASAGYLETC